MIKVLIWKENTKEFKNDCLKLIEKHCLCHVLVIAWILLLWHILVWKLFLFFGIVQRIYTLFSSSTKRWNILLKHISCFTVKSLSNTRWESRIKSVKVIRYQAPQIRAALIELYDLCDDAISKSETGSLVDALILSFALVLLFGMTFYLVLTW